MAHIHAKLMMDYAQDAMEHDQPWLLWRFYDDESDIWEDFGGNSPSWFPNKKYRRKPKTININGFEVPTPMYERPEKNTIIYVVALQTGEPLVMRSESARTTIFTNRLAHISKSDCQIHIDALLSFTKTNNEL